MNGILRNNDKSMAVRVSSPPTLADARMAMGYSLDDMAIATGLTVEEIQLAERNEAAANESHLERIRAVLKN